MDQGKTDLIVVGGGIVGLSTALHCQARGLSVLLCDPGEARRRSSYGNAGVIGRGSIFPVASPTVWKNLPRYLRNQDAGLRLDRANLWRILPWVAGFLQSSSETAWRRSAAALDPLVARSYDAHIHLGTEAGALDVIKRHGWLKLYRSDIAFAGSALERAILAEHKIATEIIDGATLPEIEPGLTRRYARAILFPETGAVSDPGRLVTAYETLFTTRGGRIGRVTVEDISAEGGDWIAHWQDGSARAPKVVIATGVWADALTRRLGYRFPLAAERGYHQHFVPGDGPKLTRPIHDTGGAYVISPMRQGIRVLSGVELAPFGSPPDLTQIRAVVADARDTVSLGAAIENEPWLGARPSTPDGLPVIGPAPRHSGIFFAFGHGHIGLSTGPATGDLMADLVIGLPPAIDLRPFSAQRFGAFGLLRRPQPLET